MGSSPRRLVFLGLLVAPLLTASAPSRSASADVPTDTTSAIAQLQREAAALLPLIKTSLARKFLGAAGTLRAVETRTLAQDTLRRSWYAIADTAALPDSIRARIVTREFDDHFYYYTRYGTPLAYARALEVLGEAGVGDVAGMKIADFGYGTIGHLRILAGLGADATGIDVDRLLEKLYAYPGDQGEVTGSGGSTGRVRVLTGRYPAEPEVTAAAGDGYDLFLSKNTLKRGYIHPEQKVDPRMLVNLGVDDTVFVRNLARILKPGGYALIYNLCPAPSPPGQPYKPWADGHSPFSKALWESAGFRVLAFDRNDDAAARAMGHALGWDSGSSPMKLDTDLFAFYTLVRKP